MDKLDSTETIIDLARSTLWLTIHLSLPILLAALIIGLGIGLIQAMTQVQEPTLVFVPKLLVVIGLITALLPHIGEEMASYYRDIMALIIGI